MRIITKIGTLVLLFVLFVCVSSSEFQTFKAKNAKNYASVVEETKRKAIFASNLKKIEVQNKKSISFSINFCQKYELLKMKKHLVFV